MTTFPGSCDGTAGRRRSLRNKPRAKEPSSDWLSCRSSNIDNGNSKHCEKNNAKVSAKEAERAATSKCTPNKRVRNRGSTAKDGVSAGSTSLRKSPRSRLVSPGQGAAAGHSKSTGPADPPGKMSSATRPPARRLRDNGGCASTRDGSVSDGSDSSSRPGSRNASRGKGSAACNERSTGITGARADPQERGESEMQDLSGEDGHPVCSRAALETKIATRSGDSGGPHGGGGRALESAVDLALSGDEDSCLVDTDSDAGSDDSQSVLCRCGSRDSKDGRCWISCDGRGCRVWEHLRCAYPERASAAEEDDDDSGGDNPPKIHFCERCKAEGFAAGVGSKGGSSLSRGGGSAATPDLSSQSPSIGFSPGKKRITREGSSANSSDVEVRRSRRVMKQQGIRTLLRKNVVGDEASGTSSSSDVADAAGSDSDVGVYLRGGSGSGEDDSDGFWAPEGQVEALEEFRCRCGATHQEEGVIGSGYPSGGAVVVDGDGGDGGACRWIQCRSDWCGVWEHAACCEHGCSARVATPGSPAPATSCRHWCQSCDPKGKKHARWKQRLRNSSRKKGPRGGGRRGQRERAGLAEPLGATGSAGGRRSTPRRRQAMDKTSGILLRRLWDAVTSADAVSVKQALLEVKGNPGKDLESAQQRLLMDGQPPRGGVDAPFGGGSGRGEEMPAAGKECARVVASGGINVVMLAAGYWKSVANDATVCSSAEGVFAGVAEAPAMDLGSGAAPAVGRSSGPAVDSAAVHSDGNLVHPDRNLVHPKGNPEKSEGEDRSLGEAATVTTEPPVPLAERDEQAAHMVLASADEPRQSGESAGVAKAPATAELHPLGDEARLAVLRLVLDKGGERSVLAVDAEGRTAVHHAAEAGASREAALLLRGEAGEQASLSKVLYYVFFQPIADLHP